ncbi:hypothetical protein AYI70_g2278 [Smittium culicis]|uniref:Uncharacterized protein n=1 Tax=Smittium culicis TaxID=133412 RepID=A0A1R1Y922_9FUNG|nr:hypothetical protein AYI70_g2278 [Smittium culicis]
MKKKAKRIIKSKLGYNKPENYIPKEDFILSNPSFQDNKYIYEIVIIYQNERGLWGSDPSPWSDITLKKAESPIDYYELSTEWEWASPRWMVHITPNTDFNGWSYSNSFKDINWYCIQSKITSLNPQSLNRKVELVANPELKKIDYSITWKEEKVGGYFIPQNITGKKKLNQSDALLKRQILQSGVPKINIEEKSPSISTTYSIYSQNQDSLSSKFHSKSKSFCFTNTPDSSISFTDSNFFTKSELIKKRHSSFDLVPNFKNFNFNEANIYSSDILAYPAYEITSSKIPKDSNTSPLVHNCLTNNPISSRKMFFPSGKTMYTNFENLSYSKKNTDMLEIPQKDFAFKPSLDRDYMPISNTKPSKLKLAYIKNYVENPFISSPQNISNITHTAQIHKIQKLPSRENSVKSIASSNSYSSSSTKSSIKTGHLTESSYDEDFVSALSHPFYLNSYSENATENSLGTNDANYNYFEIKNNKLAEISKLNANDCNENAGISLQDSALRDSSQSQMSKNSISVSKYLNPKIVTDIGSSSNVLLNTDERENSKNLDGRDSSCLVCNNLSLPIPMKVNRIISHVISFQDTLQQKLKIKSGVKNDREIIDFVCGYLHKSKSPKTRIVDSCVIWVLAPKLFNELEFNFMRQKFVNTLLEHAKYTFAENLTNKMVLFNCMCFDNYKKKQINSSEVVNNFHELENEHNLLLNKFENNGEYNAVIKKKELCYCCYQDLRYSNCMDSFFYYNSKEHKFKHGVSTKQMNFFTRRIQPTELEIIKNCYLNKLFI